MGVVDFQQERFAVKINGTISGLTPGLHGLHIHEKGDIGDGCMAAGPHYNPLEMQHGDAGRPYYTKRHVGDLGNINASELGIAKINAYYYGVPLSGQCSVIGRALVVHQGRDDLGRGNAPTSKTTGDSGARVGCGVIGIIVRMFKNFLDSCSALSSRVLLDW
ncbi:unnamed protein product [Toxocara canis]|uniref:Superoxide dismutase [Cu-Zn] n=1 Tax=Toxocara canis TaxID=6265 RepID=A0A183UYJ5_TOXCA|nr:unnamed protein product [Toxocara canis]